MTRGYAVYTDRSRNDAVPGASTIRQAAEDGVHLRWAHPDPALGDSPDCVRSLGEVERERYDATPDRRARAEFLQGRILVRQLVAELASVGPSTVDIDAQCPDCGGPHGRPTVSGPAGGATRLHVSIAHSRAAVVAAATWAGPVGVDVESTDGGAERLDAITTVAGRPFRDRAARSGDPLVHWTRVEAVLKADGRGLRVDPHLVRIHELGSWVEGRIGDEPARYRLTEPGLDPSLAVSVALRIDGLAGIGRRRLAVGWRQDDAVGDA